MGHKATSWGGSGTLKIYEITSAFKEMFLDYVNGGEDVYFEMQVVNEDPRFGREVKQITGCNFDEIVLHSSPARTASWSRSYPSPLMGWNCSKSTKMHSKKEFICL